MEYSQARLFKPLMTFLFWSIATATSSDCPAVLTLANALKMTGTAYSTLQLDCCNLTVGVTCTSGFVTEISWMYMGLTGTLTGAGLPIGLTVLNLAGNQIRGNASLCNNLPYSLRTLNLNSNIITGNINTINYFPPSLKNCDFGGNAISGVVPGLPFSLITINITANLLEGAIPLLPATLVSIEMGKNNLNGTIPTLPPNLQFLDLSYNSLTGALPEIPTTLAHLILKNNQLSSNIRVYKPTVLNIANNLFSSINVTDQSNLNYCNLKNTLINYSQLGRLAMICDTNGLSGSSFVNLLKTSTYSATPATKEPKNTTPNTSSDSGPSSTAGLAISTSSAFSVLRTFTPTTTVPTSLTPKKSSVSPIMIMQTISAAQTTFISTNTTQSSSFAGVLSSKLSSFKSSPEHLSEKNISIKSAEPISVNSTNLASKRNRKTLTNRDA